MNKERKEQKAKIDAMMKKYNTIRVIIIIALIGGLIAAELKNTDSEDTEMKNPNEVIEVESYYDRFKSEYKAFNGESVDFSEINIGELVIDDNGYNLYPNKSISEVYNAFEKTRDKLGFKDSYMELNQLRKYNGFTNIVSTSNINKIYKCEKDNESLEIYADSDGNVSNDCTKLVITVRGEGWNRVEEITTTILKNMEISEDMISAINKTNSVSDIMIKYTNSDDNMILSVDKRVSGVCESVINIYNSTDNKKTSNVYDNGYESVDGRVAYPNLLKTDRSNDFSFENIDKLFGKELENMAVVRLGEKLVDCEVTVDTKGAKLATGYIVSETDCYNILYKSESGKYEIGLDTLYTEGSAVVNLFINKLTEEPITDEERQLFKAILHEFTLVLDPKNDIQYSALKESESDAKTTHFSSTDSTGNVTTVTYTYENNKSAITLTKSYSVLSKRTAEFDTYK